MKFLKHNESLADQYKDWNRKQKDIGIDEVSKKANLIVDIKKKVLDVLIVTGFSSIKIKNLTDEPIEVNNNTENNTRLVNSLYQNEVEFRTYELDYIDEESIDEYELDYEDVSLNILLKILDVLKSSVNENKLSTDKYKQWMNRNKTAHVQPKDFGGYDKILNGEKAGEFVGGDGVFVYVTNGIPDTSFGCDTDQMGTDEDAPYGLESDQNRYGVVFEYPIMDVTGNQTYIIVKDLQEPYKSAYVYNWTSRAFDHEQITRGGIQDAGWGDVDLDKIELAYNFYN